MQTPAQRKAQIKWESENVDRISIKGRKGIKEEIKRAAERDGVSVNRWILDAIEDKL